MKRKWRYILPVGKAAEGWGRKVAKELTQTGGGSK
jgi:hypothetical protein